MKYLPDTAEIHGLKLGKLAQPIRVAMTGGTVSPPIDMTMVLIGREQVIQRLSAAAVFTMRVFEILA